jgi:hypothetical protein
VTEFPALREALAEAAQRRYGRRVRRPRMPVVLVRRAAVVVGAAVVAIAALSVVPRGHDPEPAARVPAQTLRLSRELTQAPVVLPSGRDDNRVRVAHSDLPRVAAEIERRTPYPPGISDDFDWAATPSSATAMGSIGFRSDVQALIESRAHCLWLHYWLNANARGAAAAAADAATVFADAPAWPTMRANQGGVREAWAADAAAARRGDVAAVQRATLDCHG